MRGREAYGYKEVDIYISIDTIRKATNTEDKLKQMVHFKERLLDKAISEINDKLMWSITYTPEKNGRTFVGFNFHIKSKALAILQEAGYYR